MNIFKNNIDKLPKYVFVNNVPYNLVILGREGWKVMYTHPQTNRICPLITNDYNQDLLIVVDYNFNKAVNLMLNKLKEYKII